jgi:hypothetical protein
MSFWLKLLCCLVDCDCYVCDALLSLGHVGGEGGAMVVSSGCPVKGAVDFCVGGSVSVGGLLGWRGRVEGAGQGRAAGTWRPHRRVEVP